MKLDRQKIFLLLAGAALVLALPRLAPAGAGVPTLGPASLRGTTLILDAGHGGEDGGAVSVTGTRESDLNLAVVRRVDLLAGFCGIPTILTREDDRSLHDEGAETLREKKRSDLENRVALVEGTEGAVLLSVHQNSYPDGRYSGAQVFYSNEALSGAWAEVTQETLRTALNGLREDYRTILHLLYFEELSYEQAAKVMKKSRKQIDNLAYRAKLALKVRLEKEGMEL